MEYKDYYKVLGVSKEADQDEIRKAFRKLAREYHPDANKGDAQAEERFKEINEAYQVLSDSEKRKRYDQFGANWRQYTRAGGRPEDFDWNRWTASPGGGYTRTVNIEDLEDIFGQGMGGMGAGGFSDFFETLFGGGFGSGQRVRQPRTRQGRDIQQEVDVTLEEAFHGTERIFQREDGSRMEVKIPKGVTTGSRVRVSGQGGAGVSGGKAGDLYLKIKVQSHPLFELNKNDLVVTIPVDLYTAVLGGEVEVPTIEKPVILTLPPQTDNGQKFRLRGLGMPSMRNPEKRGDLYALVDVKLPSELSEEENRLFKQLRELHEKKQ